MAVETQFCKAAGQMLSVPSPQLCVPLASGGDPTFAFNVKLSGEEVHGTSETPSNSLTLTLLSNSLDIIFSILFCEWFLLFSSVGGSFRHFVWQAVRELCSSVLPILLPCPSGATGLNFVSLSLSLSPSLSLSLH